MTHTRGCRSTSHYSLLHFQIAGVQAAIAIADVHTVEGGGTLKKPIVAMAHTDISPQQFVIVNHERYLHQPRQGHSHDDNDDEGNRFKLTDFNRMRMLRIDPELQSPCPYMVKKNSGRLRSPEEYAYLPQTEKVDVYSLGNILYMLLTNETRPFDNDSTDTAMSKVKRGERPFVSKEIRQSQDPIDRALLQAMNMCHVQEASERSTALQVANFLKANLELIDPGRLESWGLSTV
jgi:serine/threonine protein kinase